MHEKSWFEERAGKTIKRTRHDIQTGKEYTSYVHLKDQRTIDYHYEMQSKHNHYEENERLGYNYTPRKARTDGVRFSKLRLT